MLRRTVLVCLVLLEISAGTLAWGSDQTIDDAPALLAQVNGEGLTSGAGLAKRQADFMTLEEEQRQNCLRRSRQACCVHLRRKEATEFIRCANEFAWANTDQAKNPGCPGYPRCVPRG